MPGLRARSGFTLPLTIVIITVIGFLVSAFYTMVKSERMESARRFKDSQSLLEFESGINYAFYRMQNEHKPWRTDSLMHASASGNILFSLSQVQDGAFARTRVYNRDSSRIFNVHSGFNAPPRPALTLLASQADLALAGNARIKGGVATRNGTLTYSNHYKMPAGKQAFFDTLFTGDTLACFDTLKFYPELSRKQFAERFETENCTFDGSESLSGSISCKTVVFQGESRCRSCRISSDRIFVRGNAVFENANVISRAIFLKESPQLSGTFFAQDTLEASLDKPQNHPLRFIVQGRKTGETQYSGKLNIRKLTANDMLVAFMGDNWDATFLGAPLDIADSVKIRGTVVSRGTVSFSGELEGQMIAYHLGFYEKDEFWRGFLKDGKITGDTTVHTLIPDIIYLGGEASYAE